MYGIDREVGQADELLIIMKEAEDTRDAQENLQKEEKTAREEKN